LLSLLHLPALPNNDSAQAQVGRLRQQNRASQSDLSRDGTEAASETSTFSSDRCGPVTEQGDGSEDAGDQDQDRTLETGRNKGACEDQLLLLTKPFDPSTCLHCTDGEAFGREV
jgi:hypothetical protein